MSKEDKRDRVNGSEIDRGVWLVKVPKYLAAAWEEAGPGAELGTLSIYESEKGNDIELDMSENLTRIKDSNLTKLDKSQGPPVVPGIKASGLMALGKKQEKQEIPKKHMLQMSEPDNQFLAIMSEDKKSGEKKFKGHVVSRAEVRPMRSDKLYMELKKQTILQSSIPTRYTKQLERAVVNFKPVNATEAVIANEARKKAEPTKVRDEKERVQELLFTAFEKHQYYNIKDLERITRQPLSYLKEILKEVCTYNQKAPHRNMWELKPQYRHYGKSKEESTSGIGGDSIKKDEIMDSDEDME